MTNEQRDADAEPRHPDESRRAAKRPAEGELLVQLEQLREVGQLNVLAAGGLIERRQPPPRRRREGEVDAGEHCSQHGVGVGAARSSIPSRLREDVVSTWLGSGERSHRPGRNANSPSGCQPWMHPIR
jgi:hypothetical protein